jgi:alkylated DNA nucleotide flippase Atl1
MRDRSVGDTLEPMTVPNGNVYKVHLAEPSGRVTVLDVPTEDFEATERGVVLGNTIVPWHRVLRYNREITSPVDDALRSHPEMRLWVDDGTEAGETLTIRGDRFEPGPWTLDVLVERALLVEAGVYHLTKIHVPWARVLEYERSPVQARAAVGRR